MTLIDLPDHLIANIAKYLSYSDALSVSLTCQKYNSDDYWKNLCLEIGITQSDCSNKIKNLHDIVPDWKYTYQLKLMSYTDIYRSALEIKHKMLQLKKKINLIRQQIN